jgi:hypothetical protein
MRAFLTAFLLGLFLVCHGANAVEILKVQALRSGQITVDGKPSTLLDLKSRLAKIKSQNGVVYYYRDDPKRDPTPEQWAAFVAVADARVPVKMVTKADFSDTSGPKGAPPGHP